MPDPRLQQAIDHHLAGRLPEAETLYRASGRGVLVIVQHAGHHGLVRTAFARDD